MRALSASFCLFFAFLPAVLSAQKNAIRTGISGFYVAEKNSLNIGFTSFDLHVRLVSRPKFALDYGLRFIGATTGRRGGYFAFGYFSEIFLRPEKQFQAGLNVALLGGGGAAAPDKDGWLIQGTLFGQFQFRSGLAVRAGLNYAHVSSNQIKGFSPLLGFNWKLRTVNQSDSLSRPVFAWNAVYSEFGIGKFKDKELGFIGAGGNWTLGKFITGDFTIHALANMYGGYMQSLISGGPNLSIGSFHIVPAFVAGLGGGGSVKMKGGAIYGAQLGLYYSGKRFHAGIKYQHAEAVSRLFHYDGFFASIGKTFKSDQKSRVHCDLITKAYIGSGGFGNIGARFTAYQYRKLRLMGGTHWAFTHNRGAYAEGLFEATLDAPGSIPLYFVASAGAGGGAGINHTSASLIYSAGIGYVSPYERLPFRLECAYWDGGNIPQWSLAFSWSIGK